MVENKLCQGCAKFQIEEEKPASIKKVAKDVFFNEDGSEKELSPLAMLFGLQVSFSKYGQRRCSNWGAGLGLTDCQVPDEYEPRS